MSPVAWILDVPENQPIIEAANEDAHVSVEAVGPYYRITSDRPIVIDRRSTGARHAVWYSCLAALSDARVTQWDKEALRVEDDG